MKKRALLLGPGFDVGAVEAALSTELEVIRDQDMSADELDALLPTVHALCTGTARADLLDRAISLEVIGVPASGYDGIDIDAANRLGISVVLGAGAQYNAVAEHAIGLILSLSKRIGWSDRRMHATGKYVPRSQYMGQGFPHEVKGKCVLILGFGFIGRDLARKCHLGFDMRVLAYDPYGDPLDASRQHVRLTRRITEMREVLGEADFVVLTLPLTPETRGIIGAEELERMKPSAFLVNCSRGGTVDEAALIAALQANTIAGAGIDVFEREPTEDDHPFFSMDQVIVTPHIGGWVEEAFPRLAQAVCDQMLGVLHGERPLRSPNPEIWNAPHRRAGR